MDISERTTNSVFNEWFLHFRTPHLQQFSNLYSVTIALLKLYNASNKNDAEIANITRLFFHPIPKFKELFPEQIKIKKSLDWDIPKLEWCYYRDTKFKSKLGKEYFEDSMKQRETEKIFFKDIVTILSLFKTHLFKNMITVLIEERVDLNLSIPATQLTQVSESDIA